MDSLDKKLFLSFVLIHYYYFASRKIKTVNCSTTHRCFPTTITIATSNWYYHDYLQEFRDYNRNLRKNKIESILLVNTARRNTLKYKKCIFRTPRKKHQLESTIQYQQLYSLESQVAEHHDPCCQFPSFLYHTLRTQSLFRYDFPLE